VGEWVDFIMKWFIKCFKDYANFKGRASRAELWYFLLVWSIFYVIIILIDRQIGYNFISLKDLPLKEYLPIGKFYSEIGILVVIYRPLTIIPSIAVVIRRLHDMNMSGKWTLLFLIPPIGILLLLYLVKSGDNDENQYGSVPES
jgi:uncharacterized membrane protein YhaH (DUF805 family)